MNVALPDRVEQPVELKELRAVQREALYRTGKPLVTESKILTRDYLNAYQSAAQ